MFSCVYHSIAISSRKILRSVCGIPNVTALCIICLLHWTCHTENSTTAATPAPPITCGSTQAQSTTPPTDTPPEKPDLECDVAIVGGGEKNLNFMKRYRAFLCDVIAAMLEGKNNTFSLDLFSCKTVLLFQPSNMAAVKTLY